MTPNKNQRTLTGAVGRIAPVIGLMIAVFTLLEKLLPTSLVQPIAALVIGLGLIVILVWVGKLDWGTALPLWSIASIGLIILHLVVSRPTTVIGTVVDSSGSPVTGLRLVLTDSDGVDHRAVTDENGAFEIRNVPEGKFTVLANGELLISRQAPSGWKRIVDSKTEIGALVHRPGPTATPVITPTNTPTAIPTPTNTSMPETPTSTLTPTPTPINATVNVEALNLRAGPGVEYPVIGQLQQGDVVIVIGQNLGGDWLAVEYEGKIGWVAKEYVKAPAEVAMVPTAEVPPTPTSTSLPEPTATPTPTEIPSLTTPPPTTPPPTTPPPAPTPTPTHTATPTSTPTAPSTSTLTPSPTATPTITWRHNPALPAPVGYPGDISVHEHTDYPGTHNGVEFSITGEQILIVEGSAGFLPDVGPMGGQTSCFLLMTRGPFSSSIDLFEAALEIHNVAPNADALVWAAQKAHDMKAIHPDTCGQEMDIWIGR